MCSEVLPLVEFYLEDDISDEEAVSLIDLEVPRVERNSSWQEMSGGGNVSFTFTLHIHSHADIILGRLWTNWQILTRFCVQNCSMTILTNG